MQDVTVGLVFRAVRRRLRLTQRHAGNRAHVSQQTVSLIELGRLDQVDLATLRRVGAVLGIEVPFAPRWRGPELDRLLDAGHARLVEAVVGDLGRGSWAVEVEWSFNHFGERGAVDVLGWHPERRALLVVEVKTRIVDLQDLLGTLDRKVRVAVELLPRDRGWHPDVVGRVVVLPGGSTSRDAVDRHRAIFDATLPQRTIEVRHWLGDPRGGLRAIWFLRSTGGVGAPRR
jgi:transcriptional regulator with XRE-family HTH domain